VSIRSLELGLQDASCALSQQMGRAPPEPGQALCPALALSVMRPAGNVLWQRFDPAYTGSAPAAGETCSIHANYTRVVGDDKRRWRVVLLCAVAEARGIREAA